jgi:hypothetical protein
MHILSELERAAHDQDWEQAKRLAKSVLQTIDGMPTSPQKKSAERRLKNTLDRCPQPFRRQGNMTLNEWSTYLTKCRLYE